MKDKTDKDSEINSFPIHWVGEDKEKRVAQEIVTTTKGIKLRNYKYKHNKNGDYRLTETKLIISNNFKVISELLTDEEERRFSVKVGDELIEDNPKNIIERIKNYGVVIEARSIDDVISGLITQARCNGLPVIYRWSATGIYIRDGKIVPIIIEACPSTPEQAAQKEHMTISWGKGGIEALKAYRELLKWFEPYEIVPAMGICPIAPLVYEIKKAGGCDFIPYILLHGPRGIGKTTVAKAFTSIAYGTKENTAKMLDSEFRFAEILNSTTLPVRIAEMEQFSFEKYSAKIKSATESAELDIRGTSDLKLKRYAARAYLIMDANAQPITDPNLHPRIVRIGFNSSHIRDRQDNQKREEFHTKILGQLDNVGQYLIEALINKLMKEGKDPIKVLTDYVKTIEKDLEASKVDYSDSRRIFFWALCWIGLQIWNDIFQAQGIPLLDLSFEKYIQDVVEHIENENIEERDIGVIPQIRAWFEGKIQSWKIYDSKEGVDTAIRGKDDTWKLEKIETGQEGYWITQAILREYEEHASRTGGLPRFKSLPDLARSVAQYRGGSWEYYYRPVRFKGHLKKAVWIPLDDQQILNTTGADIK